MDKNPWIHVYKALPPGLLRQLVPAANDGVFHSVHLGLGLGQHLCERDFSLGECAHSLHAPNWYAVRLPLGDCAGGNSEEAGQAFRPQFFLVKPCVEFHDGIRLDETNPSVKIFLDLFFVTSSHGRD